jgi:hypothetical protein
LTTHEFNAIAVEPAQKRENGMLSEAHYLGMVVMGKGGSLLADLTVHGRPTVNDLATLLANLMRRPLEGDSPAPPHPLAGAPPVEGTVPRPC